MSFKYRQKGKLWNEYKESQAWKNSKKHLVEFVKVKIYY